MRSGATLVYSKAQIMSPPETSQYGSVPIGGGTVINTNCGYPNAADVYHELLIDSTAFTPFSTDSYLTEFRLDGASNPATCKLVYIAPDTADKQAQITVETTGC